MTRRPAEEAPVMAECHLCLAEFGPIPADAEEVSELCFTCNSAFHFLAVGLELLMDGRK